jgi:hypothetical protein
MKREAIETTEATSPTILEKDVASSPDATCVPAHTIFSPFE